LPLEKISVVHSDRTNRSYLNPRSASKHVKGGNGVSTSEVEEREEERTRLNGGSQSQPAFMRHDDHMTMEQFHAFVGHFYPAGKIRSLVAFVRTSKQQFEVVRERRMALKKTL
jgi:hypothetical protein